MQAHGLAAADWWNGKSDPYCLLRLHAPGGEEVVQYRRARLLQLCVNKGPCLLMKNAVLDLAPRRPLSKPALMSTLPLGALGCPAACPLVPRAAQPRALHTYAQPSASAATVQDPHRVQRSQPPV